MKKRVKNKLVLLFAGLTALFAAAGCSTGESMEEFLENRDLYSHVTYYANGGSFEGSDVIKYMHFNAGSQAFNLGIVGTTSGTVEINRLNYTFGGWYNAVLDENGEPKYTVQTQVDKDGNSSEVRIYELGDPVDFSVRLQKDEYRHFVAKWNANVRVDVQLVCFDENGNIDPDATVKEEGNDTPYTHHAVIGGFTYDTTDKAAVRDTTELFTRADKEYTFVSYYADESCSDESRITEDILKGEDQQENAVVYAKYIKGDWTVIRERIDISSIFKGNGEGKRFWLYKDIDGKNAGINFKSELSTANKDFAGEIQGNGFKISNVKADVTLKNKNDSMSLFGNILETAIIKNFTIENLTVKYTVRSTAGSTMTGATYFAFTSVHESATLENVKLTGTMSVNKSSTAEITVGQYGGYADGEYTGMTIECTIEE